MALWARKVLAFRRGLRAFCRESVAASIAFHHVAYTRSRWMRCSTGVSWQLVLLFEYHFQCGLSSTFAPDCARCLPSYERTLPFVASWSALPSSSTWLAFQLTFILSLCAVMQYGLAVPLKASMNQNGPYSHCRLASDSPSVPFKYTPGCNRVSMSILLLALRLYICLDPYCACIGH